MTRFNLFIVGCLLVLMFGACREKRQHPMQGMSNAEMKELLMESSKYHAQQEDKQINVYLAERSETMDVSPTGLRYRIYREDEPCDSILSDQRVVLNYEVRLLDGTLCYTSEKTGPRAFVVDHDDVESGLHEGVKYMCYGDSAVMLLPSYLAHGLTGDGQKIPSNSPVLYYLRVFPR